MIEHVRVSRREAALSALEFVVSASEKILRLKYFPAFHQQFGVELFDSIAAPRSPMKWIANRQKEFNARQPRQAHFRLPRSGW